MIRKENRSLYMLFREVWTTLVLLSFLLIHVPLVLGAQITVWLDNGAKAPGSTSTGQAYANLHDATWDVTATQGERLGGYRLRR